MKLIPYLSFILLYYLIRILILTPQNGVFSISFLNVGQGDSIVINIPKYGQVMIDTGPDYQANYLSARESWFPICQIKSVIITHYDSDHSGGLNRMSNYCKKLKNYNNIKNGDTLHFGDTYLHVLNPAVEDISREENDDSIVILLDKGSFEALLTGDAGTAIVEELLPKIEAYTKDYVVNNGLDVYKVSHHGSKYNTNFDIIRRLKPTSCVIPVGKNNFGHPSKEVISYLKDSGCRVYRTDLEGSVTFYGR